jgi:hypothetical protein
MELKMEPPPFDMLECERFDMVAGLRVAAFNRESVRAIYVRRARVDGPRERERLKMAAEL